MWSPTGWYQSQQCFLQDWHCLLVYSRKAHSLPGYCMSSLTSLSAGRTGQFHDSSLLFEVDGGNFSPFPAPLFVWSSPSTLCQLVLVWLLLEVLAELFQLTPTAGNYTNWGSFWGSFLQLCEGRWPTEDLSLSGTRQAAGTKGWEQGEGRGEAEVDVCLLVPVQWPKLSLWGMTGS